MTGKEGGELKRGHPPAAPGQIRPPCDKHAEDGCRRAPWELKGWLCSVAPLTAGCRWAGCSGLLRNWSRTVPRSSSPAAGQRTHLLTARRAPARTPCTGPCTLVLRGRRPEQGLQHEADGYSARRAEKSWTDGIELFAAG